MPNRRVNTSNKTIYGIKYYSNSSKINGVMMKVIFVCITASVIMFCAVLLGLHLKNKVNNIAPSSDLNTAGAETGNGVSEPQSPANIGSAGGASEKFAQNSINGDCLDISETASLSPEKINSAVVNIVDQGYSAVSVNLTDTDGNLLYLSDAAASVSRIKADNSSGKSLPDIEVLKSIASAAGELKIPCSAIITIDFSNRKNHSDDSIAYEAALFFDCAIVKELESIGFTEIILRGYTFSGIEREQIAFDASDINEYIKALKAAAPGVLVGIALPPDIYRNVRYTPAIESISQKADILAIDICYEIHTETNPDDIFNAVSDICTAIPGSFSMYNIRALLSGDSAQVRTAQIDALVYNSINNWQFIPTH